MKHLICLTVDTDPDNLSGKTTNRKDLSWEGLNFAFETFPKALSDYPLTWFVRADGQLDAEYGSPMYLLETYADFWRGAVARGDELGWHPHLYTVPSDDSEPEIITEPQQAVAELQRIWAFVKDYPLPMPSFRMGEGWHTRETLNLVESFGFGVDSTAIPDRDDSSSGHPRNWKGCPNQPYFPQNEDIRLAGEKRDLLEVPMNTWLFQTDYDKAPKLRYMNPCVHSRYWEQGLNYLEEYIKRNLAETYVWVLIIHPSEASPKDEKDLLYAHSLAVLQQNLGLFEESLRKMGHQYLYTTLDESAKWWHISE